jgi:4-amino-4-deoxy-L-arabinose transferase-like glycosyltransferase
MTSTRTAGIARDTGDSVSRDPAGWKWLLEPECLLLALVVMGMYFTRLSAPNLRGEEPRRGRVAVEMIESGDWIAPRQQGQLFFSRPPLQNWLIAVLGMVRGGVDEVAIRLPSAVSILLASLIIYGYARTFLSSAAALVAGLAFASMGQVLELGRLGETESLYILVVGGALLFWHWGHSCGWPPLWTWCGAYSFAALGMLAKGPQAPVYFVSSVGVFLVATRRWREIVSWPHLAGIAAFAVVWNAWQIPYALREGVAAAYRMYTNDVALRFEDTSWRMILTHLAKYPVEISVCLLPWSALLVAYFYPSFWRSMQNRRSNVLFLACCIAVTFPSCWFVPGAKSRYFMPLYPCFALLIGVVVEQCWRSTAAGAWRNAWRSYLMVLTAVMALAGLAIPLLSLIPRGAIVAQPLWFAIALAAASLLLAGVAWWSVDAATETKRRAGALAVSIFLGLTFIGPVTNLRIAASTDTQSQVAAMREIIPRGTTLYSVGLIDSLFAYYYEEPIKVIQAPASGGQWPAEATYFCWGPSPDGASPQLDFSWEPIAVISCDRTRRDTIQRKIVVARRADGGHTK